MPSPPLAVALAFKDRLVNSKRINVEDEAMAMVAIICGRTTGLTLAPLTAAYHTYAEKLAKDDPIFELLRERFIEVAAEMDEEALTRIHAEATMPSQAQAIIEDAKRRWGAPEKSIAADFFLFAGSQAFIDEMRKATESTLTARLEFCVTRGSILSLEEEVERELGGGPSILRARLLQAKKSHRERVETEAQTQYGWPPKGCATRLAHAARWFAMELGPGHLVVEDFVAATCREIKKAEKIADEELAPVDASVCELRERLESKLAASASLVAEAWKAELAEMLEEAKPVLNKWLEELDYESPMIIKRFCSIWSKETTAQRLLAEASAAADELRGRPADSPEEEEPRLQAASRLFQILEILQATGDSLLVAACEYSAEFERELDTVRPLISLTRPDMLLERFDEGWHQPPGFIGVEQPLAPEEPAETVVAPSTEEPVAEEVTAHRADISMCMKLHSVSVEDTRSRSELLLLERCAGIIAQECGIPRSWISNIAFQRVTRKVSPSKPSPGKRTGSRGGSRVRPATESRQSSRTPSISSGV